MCRNITTLRGLEPAATAEEIEAGARQYVRKITGVQQTSAVTEAAIERAVAEIAAISTRVLRELPPRRQPPMTEPPSRRRARARTDTGPRSAPRQE